MPSSVWFIVLLHRWIHTMTVGLDAIGKLGGVEHFDALLDRGGMGIQPAQHSIGSAFLARMGASPRG